MFEFNPDGSIKLPSRLTKQTDENNNIFASKPSFKVLRNQTSTMTPLTCELTIEASKLIQNPNIIEDTFKDARNLFRNDSALSIKKEENTYVVKIISGFNRCQWCHQFLNHLSDRANARIIRTDKCENKFKPGNY